MIQDINISENFLYNHKLRQHDAEQYVLTQKMIEKVKRISFKKIKYPEHQEAYDYVDNLFPSVKIKEVAVHKVLSKDLIKMGLDGVEGFYEPVTKIVVLSGSHRSSRHGNTHYKVDFKIEPDEVIVHELLHYCYHVSGHRSISSEMREEFAYGWSIGYLRQNGHSDDFIIRYNFLPYLIGLFNDKSTTKILAQNGITTAQYNTFSKYRKKECEKTYGRKAFELAKKMAMERGQKIVDIYSDKLKEGGYSEVKVNKHGRLSMLDFSK